MRRDPINPLALLVGLILAFTAWNAFDDKPRAFYHCMALLGVGLMLAIGWRAHKRLAVVCAYGVFLYGSTSACDLSYFKEANGWQYMCDAGTSAPVSAITLAVGVLIAGWLLGGRDG